MKYVSVDIETSGLDHQLNNILSVGAIIEDTEKKVPFEECPKFNAIILNREICGSPRAITMNKGIIALMGEYLEGDNEMKQHLQTNSGYVFLEKDDVAKEFYLFLHENGYAHDLTNSGGYMQIKDGKQLPVLNSGTKPITINVAGKNFGTFDKLFLQELPWWKKLIHIRQRIIDPAILFCDWENDKALPSLTTCKERAKIDGQVSHNALEDAWDVINVLRQNY